MWKYFFKKQAKDIAENIKKEADIIKKPAIIIDMKDLTEDFV